MISLFMNSHTGIAKRQRKFIRRVLQIIINKNHFFTRKTRKKISAQLSQAVHSPYPIHEPHISSHWLTPDAVLPFSFRSQHHDATRRQSRESLPL
ncbi:hypothetical protein, partial [Pseudomonas syringae group genomosp. 3]|uniref:hypothetical protein n=1 Tax=Pseudomonas syringae group genomosp. 3 TaxID=251701 RepID=UPI00128C0BB8